MSDEITNRLRISEIFHSIQGESLTSGERTVFVRLTGCPLRCQYCDTAYAFSGGTIKSMDAIIDEIKAFGCNHVCVTGGEPLAQKGCLKLLTSLCDLNYFVSLETSGALDISSVDKRVMVVMDLKTPGSLEVAKNNLANFEHLKPTDQIKFVLCNRSDYEWACEQIKVHSLRDKAKILFSASFDELSSTELAQWIIDDKLNVRFQMQLHKILWNDARGR
jgi:7-carboxy-7-deazaguanine synthase